MQLVLACAALSAVILSGQPAAPKKPGSVEGVVTNSVTGEPVKKAVVSLQPFGGNSNYAAATDSAGHFHFDSVEPGTYQAIAQRDGFIPAHDGFHGSLGAKPFVLAEEQHVKDLVVKLLPLAVVSGHVLDEDGDPIVRANVQALRYVYDRGGKQLNPAGFASTNDLGEYQFTNLPPGRFFFQVVPQQRMPNLPPRTRSAKPEEEYPAIFYPNAADPTQTTATQVPPGGRLTNIDFRLHKTRAYHVRGKAIDGQTGQPVPNFSLRLQRRESSFFADGNFVGVQPDGTFDMRGIASGTYIVIGQRQEGTTMVSTEQVVNVGDQNVDNVVLAFRPPIEISGAVRVEGALPEYAGTIQVILEPIERGWESGTNAIVNSDGSFVLKAAPGVYRININRQAGSYVKSIRLGAQDVSNGRVDLTQAGPGSLNIVFATDVGALSGAVQTKDGEPAANAMITAAPEGEYEDRPDLFILLGTDQNGKFDYRDFAPGDYKVLAWANTDEIPLQSAEFRKAFSSWAASVTIPPSGRAPVQLTLIPAEDIEAEKNKMP